MNTRQPQMYNAADKAQVKQAKLSEKAIANQELDDLRFVMNSPQGRRFLWKHLSGCRLYKQSYTGSADTNFNEGKRKIGLLLLGDIMDASKEAYLLMQKEADLGAIND